MILIPEIPYSVKPLPGRSGRRSERGTNFSIVAIAEGALSREYAARFRQAKARRSKARSESGAGAARRLSWPISISTMPGTRCGWRTSLEKLTGLEAPRHHPRLRAAGRHAVGGGPAAGHAARHGLRRLDPGAESSASWSPSQARARVSRAARAGRG